MPGVSRRESAGADACAAHPEKGNSVTRPPHKRGPDAPRPFAAGHPQAGRAASANRWLPARRQLRPRRRPNGRSLAFAPSRRPVAEVAAGVRKFEIRSTKHETNSKHEIQVENRSARLPRTLEFHSFVLLSDFVLRALDFSCMLR